MINVLSEFIDEGNKRTSIVYLDDTSTIYGVLMYIDGAIVEDRKCPGHSLRYVEDLAENWINTWGEFSV